MKLNFNHLIRITLACIKFFKRSKLYQVILKRHFILSSKIPFIVFRQVCLWRSIWIPHNNFYTIIILIQEPVDSTFYNWSLVSDVLYCKNVACVPNYNVPPYSLTSTYLECVRIIPLVKMILMYFVKYQKRAECWFFSFQFDILITGRIDGKCKNNHEGLWYIYGNIVLPNNQAKVTDFLKKAYCNYFGVKLVDQDTTHSPGLL